MRDDIQTGSKLDAIELSRLCHATIDGGRLIDDGMGRSVAWVGQVHADLLGLLRAACTRHGRLPERVCQSNCLSHGLGCVR